MNSRSTKFVVCNETNGAILARSSELAGNLWERCRGLLGRSGLRSGEGMILKPCQAIHTLFMRFPIDVVFVDRDSRVVAWIGNMKPFRISRWYPRTAWVLELPAGTLSAEQIRVGDLLSVSGDEEEE